MFPPYEFTDLNPTLDLLEITPLSKRAWTALTRHQNGRAAKAGQMNIIGAIDMIDGLEYHHANHMSVIGQLSKLPPFSEESFRQQKNLLHEVFAYLNRMCQFYYFSQSAFVKQFLSDPNSLIPTIIEYKPFRDKHGAHRAIDYPHKEDTLQAQSNYAWALSSMGGRQFFPKSDNPRVGVLQFLDPHNQWINNYHLLQLFNGQENSIEFSLEREHPTISKEAYSVLEAILSAH